MSSKPSKMSNTEIYVGEATYNDKLVHVLAYQNKAITNSPNCMILPFPTDKKMDDKNVIDTSKFSSFLSDITKASKIETFSDGRRSMTLGAVRASALVFESGSYTVVLANNIDEIPEALSRVPELKRPSISNEFLQGFENLYPNDKIALCCWNGTIKPEPLLWWYEPRNKDSLFVPTMDAHDGNSPNINVKVKTDHLISVSHRDDGNNFKVVYKDKIPNNIKSLLPTKVTSAQLDLLMLNGDCSISLKYEFPLLRRGNNFINSLFIKMEGWE